MTCLFKPGDIVTYTNELYGPVKELSLGNDYVVTAIIDDEWVILDDMPRWATWDCRRFTLKESV